MNNVQLGPIDTDTNPANGAFAEGLKALMALPRYGRDEGRRHGRLPRRPESRLRHRRQPTIDGGFAA